MYKTVEELGNRLPSDYREFTFYPHTGKREKEIYYILNANGKQAQTTNFQVRACLAVLLKQVGSVIFPAPSPSIEEKLLEEKLRLFDTLRLSVGEAYYMYLKLRIETLGSELKMLLGCPNEKCGHKGSYTVDLSGLKIKCAEANAELTSEKELPKPITLNGKKYDKVIVSPASIRFYGGTYESMSDVKLDTICSNVKVVGYDFPLAPELLEDEGISTINFLYNAIDELTYGLDEVLEFKCGGCDRIVPYIVSWEYPSFFQ